MVYILIYLTSDYLPLMSQKQQICQTVYFALGILAGCVFYSYNFRFLPSFIVVLLLFAGVGALIDNFAPGEFDSFFLAVDFVLFRALFIIGWICGWGFSRSKYFPAVFAALLLTAGLLLTALSGETGAGSLVKHFAPIMLFAFYIIFMNELLRNTDEKELRSWTVPLRNLFVYSIAMGLLLLLTFSLFRREIKLLEAKWDDIAAQDDQNSLNKTMPDSTVKMKPLMQVNDRLNRNGQNSENRPLFVAYLDNFFPDSDIPNPLYFVCNYFPLFDNYTETFEPDSLMPYNDLFAPDPSKIPLYFAESSDRVIKNGMSDAYRKTVEAEVYKIAVSPTEFIAPATAFYCQPIAVKSDLRDKYHSAYRAKMWVSELNSAYFVYNNTEQDWRAQRFQEQRFALLREIRNYNLVDTAFVNYYTRFPDSPAYDTIRKLARAIVENADARTPIDKAIAIRDYFMQTDELGEHLFHYADVLTTVPPGSRILNFLLNEHTGNCTYYAGSTLLLLRACGIPARIATGYALIDRSSNNKGWYWIYNKQAHAWVQIFFPQYGWLDFDTTFGDSEQQEAPGTDGTPPLDPQKAWFAATGVVHKVDSVRRRVDFDLDQLVLYDREIKLTGLHRLTLDLSIATVYRDSTLIPANKVKVGDKALALSFTPLEDATPKTVEALPNTVPVDELRIDNTDDKPATDTDADKRNTRTGKVFDWLLTALLFAAIVITAIAMILSVPSIVFAIYDRKARRIVNPDTESYYPYRAATFLLHQMGYFRNKLTPLQYAGKIDKQLGTSFEAFTATYLKVKYAGQKLTNEDSQRLLTFYAPFRRSIKNSTGLKQYRLNFLNIYNTLEFFTKPEQ
jgi:transglutaminase-like putative cysteine protease